MNYNELVHRKKELEQLGVKGFVWQAKVMGVSAKQMDWVKEYESINKVLNKVKK